MFNCTGEHVLLGLQKHISQSVLNSDALNTGRICFVIYLILGIPAAIIIIIIIVPRQDC